MAISHQRHVLENVERVQFGPPSDIFSVALRAALQYMGRDGSYEQILAGSGRAFKIVWNSEMFYWDKYLDGPDADPEYYLRDDYASMAAAVVAMRYAPLIVGNSECTGPGGKTPEGARFDREANRKGIRDYVLESLRHNRPVVTAINVTGEGFWAPEMGVLTGYDAGGDVIMGWSPFQEEPAAKERCEYDPSGTFRMLDWERETLAIILLQGEPEVELDGHELSRGALEHALAYSKGFVEETEAWGFEAYEAWAAAIGDDERLSSGSDEIVGGSLQYHRGFIGHLAAQKHYTSSFLRRWQKGSWNVSDILHAAGCYSRIHELAWDCWKVVGGYWREPGTQIPLFRDKQHRAQVIAIIRQMQEQDRRAVAHLQAAFDAWDKSTQPISSRNDGRIRDNW